MSRVYEALQAARVDPGVAGDGRTDAVFSKLFAGSVWDPSAVPSVQPRLSDQERLPALFSMHSLASEQFGLLATRLQQQQRSRVFKSVLVTSAVAGEGKSLLILNLAVALAHGRQQKVLVLDADLRKPGLSLNFDVDGRAGLREWHQTNRPVCEFICRIADLNAWLLPAGQAMADPLELLKSPRIPELLTSLNTAFDWVLIDSPPLLPLADAEIISRICDGTIIVVRRDKSPKTALKQALKRIPAAKMAGLLLNDFPSVATYGYRQNGRTESRQPATEQQSRQVAGLSR